MVAMRKLKDETMDILQGYDNTGNLFEDSDYAIDVFLEVLKHHGGAITFPLPDRGPAKVVQVQQAGEQSSAAYRR